MIALDSSVAVAGFGPWHEHHTQARKILAGAPRIPAHAALETYSVLTRLPEPFRAEPQLVADYLHQTFPDRGHLLLDAAEYAALPTRLAALGIGGGAVYDALIGLTAASAGAELVTFDRRALPNYERCGVSTRLIA